MWVGSKVYLRVKVSYFNPFLHTCSCKDTLSWGILEVGGRRLEKGDGQIAHLQFVHFP